MGKTIAKIADRAAGRVTSRPNTKAQARVKGIVNTKCYRAGELIWEDTSENMIVAAGLDYLIGVAVGATAQQASWFCGLLDASPTFSATNTITDMSELTEYTAAARPTWVGLNTSTGTEDNSASVAAYTISAAVTCGGVFLVSTETKGADTGILYAGVAFTGGNRILAASDKLEVTYTHSVADS
jgi:hypothetical protein